MKRLKFDPLRDKDGTLRMEYRMVTDKGVTIHAQTRALRCSPEQWERLNAFLQELAAATPEIHGAAEPDEPTSGERLGSRVRRIGERSRQSGRAGGV